MTDQALIELAAKVEAAEGPSRGLDAEIALAVFCPSWAEDERWADFAGDRKPKSFLDSWEKTTSDYGYTNRKDLPSYTASLDAAMTLVPEGCDWFKLPRTDDSVHMEVQQIRSIGAGWPGDCFYFSKAATPALALAAASLRALASDKTEEG